ncbi:MAG: hypothetical protein RLZZ450_7401 [Pseudomonadota bacterium]|jgi:hypothetical protein
MGVECASCGQIIPPGQFRCGNCGTVQTRDSVDDYAGLTELTAAGEVQRTSPSEPVLPARVGSQSSAEGQRLVAPPLEDDDSGVREPLVPRGTFASVLPDRVAEGDERERVRLAPERDPSSVKPAAAAQPSIFRSRAGEDPAASTLRSRAGEDPAASTLRSRAGEDPAASTTTSQRIKSVRPPVRPPYLASEILREDLTPSEPGRRHMNVVLQVAPALGAVAVLSSGIDRMATWLSLGVLALLFSLTRFELHYQTLSLVVVGVGVAGLSFSSGWRLVMGGSSDGPLLAATVTLLAAALLFRTWYRATYTARVLVTLALVLALTWATWTSHRELLALEFDWQSWLPALAWYVFGILCLLSLLAFMGGETTGGCDVWALGLSIWYGLFACVRFSLEGVLGGGSYPPNFQTLGLLEPALSAPTAVALAQMFSRIFGRGRRTR